MIDNKLYIETTEGWLVYIALNKLPMINVMDLCLDSNRNIKNSAISNLIERESINQIKKIFKFANNLCHSNLSKKKEVGVLILGELGYKVNYPHLVQSIQIFKHLINDKTLRVKNAVLLSIGHLFKEVKLEDKGLIDKIILLSNVKNIKLVVNVAFALGGCVPYINVMSKLNELLVYNNKDVSDWAEISIEKLMDIQVI